MQNKSISVIELNARLKGLEDQRNIALTESVVKTGQLAVAGLRIQELEKKLAALLNPALDSHNHSNHIDENVALPGS